MIRYKTQWKNTNNCIDIIVIIKHTLALYKKRDRPAITQMIIAVHITGKFSIHDAWMFPCVTLLFWNEQSIKEVHNTARLHVED